MSSNYSVLQVLITDIRFSFPRSHQKPRSPHHCSLSFSSGGRVGGNSLFVIGLWSGGAIETLNFDCEFCYQLRWYEL
ncbi:hypothetical protein L1987_70111 [Smallanthus sonchifolius]|uniref:Uncharacterized protein n=1 Tax=Smallanthus sonchifolius TaxID=185202 RepID=A0ACB9AN39_9ASTR|nr:hypothetical protein L1987_70111 [Smallanthus sonchifolius]